MTMIHWFKRVRLAGGIEVTSFRYDYQSTECGLQVRETWPPTSASPPGVRGTTFGGDDPKANVFEVATSGHIVCERCVANREHNYQEAQRNPEAVNHPAHYNMGSIEVIDAIEAWGLGFNDGNAVKYIARARHKDKHLEDLKKARWYIDREISNLEKAEEGT